MELFILYHKLIKPSICDETRSSNCNVIIKVLLELPIFDTQL